MEKEVPAINLVVPPLPDHEVPVVLDGDPQALEGGLRFAGTVLQLLEVLP